MMPAVYRAKDPSVLLHLLSTSLLVNRQLLFVNRLNSVSNSYIYDNIMFGKPCH